MGYLVRLTSLDLGHNMLKELPPDLTNMRGMIYNNVSIHMICLI